MKKLPYQKSYSQIARRIAKSQLRQYVYYKTHPSEDFIYRYYDDSGELKIAKCGDLSIYLRYYRISYRPEIIRIRAAKSFIRNGKKFFKKFHEKAFN